MKNDLNFLLNKKDVMTDGGEQNYIGGTIMGNYYKLSVLDKNLKLHLTENLHFLIDQLTSLENILIQHLLVFNLVAD